MRSKHIGTITRMETMMTAKETVLKDYLEKLGAKESVPGGGGASALAGAELTV